MFFVFFAIKTGALNNNFKTQKVDTADIDTNPFCRVETIQRLLSLISPNSSYKDVP